MDSDEGFPAAVQREFAFLITEHGFRLTSDEDRRVRFESSTVGVTATFDPRGEIEVRVAQLGRERGFGTLSLDAMVGRASMSRVVELLAERLCQHDDALRGETAYFEKLADQQRVESEAWTAYYAGQGPPPSTGRLP
jgi:hypothetical protein